MSRHQARAEHVMFGTKTTEDLVELLNQSLADTLDLAYQTKQAHWNVKGPNFYGLHRLFDQLHTQTLAYADDFAERAVTLGGQARGTIRAASAASYLSEYPLEARDGRLHVEVLVDRYGEYTGRLRHAIREAEQLGDQDTADLYIAVSRGADRALWMLKSHQDV